MSLAAVLAISALNPTVFGQGTDQVQTEVYAEQEVVANQILVKFREPLSSERDALLQYVSDADRFLGIGGAGWFVIHSRTKNVADLVDATKPFEEIQATQPDYIYHTRRLPNDPSFASQWSLQNTGQVINGQAGTAGSDIKAPAAWDTSTGSASFVIGIVDTGIAYNHPDLASNVWAAPSQFTVTIGGQQITCVAGTHGFNARNNTCDPLDDNFHGTHVAGIAGAVGNNASGISGVNWTTKLMGLKFMDATGHGQTSHAVNAIEFAVQARMRSGIVRVLNASWSCQPENCSSCSEDGALRDEIGRANDWNMLFVAAAGNCATNNNTVNVYPANTNKPNVVAVAATDNRDALASFSNFGSSKVHLGAPGVGILSTYPPDAYVSLDGTSMAAPHVSGAGALVRAACPFNTGWLKQTILNNVDSVSSLAGKTITGGRLNLQRALASCTVGTSGSASYAYIKYRLCPPFRWPDHGTVSVTIDGVAYTIGWDQNDTPRMIADRVASFVNFDPDGTSTATVSDIGSVCSGRYDAQLTLRARAKGPLTNYAYWLGLFDQGGCGPPCPYFQVLPTVVFHFSGGAN